MGKKLRQGKYQELSMLKSELSQIKEMEDHESKKTALERYNDVYDRFSYNFWGRSGIEDELKSARRH